MESRADRRTSHALHTVTTHDHASDRPGYFIGELRLNRQYVWPGEVPNRYLCDCGATARRSACRPLAV